MHDGGGIDQHIELPELRRNPGRQRARGLGIGEIGLEAEGAAAAQHDGGAERLGAIARCVVVERHGHAAPGECLGERAPEPPPRARHQGDAAGQFHD